MITNTQITWLVVAGLLTWSGIQASEAIQRTYDNNKAISELLILLEHEKEIKALELEIIKAEHEEHEERPHISVPPAPSEN